MLHKSTESEKSRSFATFCSVPSLAIVFVIVILASAYSVNGQAIEGNLSSDQRRLLLREIRTSHASTSLKHKVTVKADSTSSVSPTPASVDEEVKTISPSTLESYLESSISPSYVVAGGKIDSSNDDDAQSGHPHEDEDSVAKTLHPSPSANIVESLSPSTKISTRASLHPSVYVTLNPTILVTLNPTPIIGYNTPFPIEFYTPFPTLDHVTFNPTTHRLHPTEPPTVAVSPTLAPSEETTSTVSPTVFPTVSPIEEPVTEIISLSPTEFPTDSPPSASTDEPTSNFTEEPTLVPNAEPTSKPTKSDEPSYDPTAFPTSQQTTAETGVPTNKPTKVPSDEPTSKPTKVPSDEPSCDPTAFPTLQPTAVETGVPTNKPTKAPSDEPTSKPTKVPSDEPSCDPTAFPTSQPTAVETGVPTSKPTKVPSDEPTSKPTKVPSDEPSCDPTAFPTLQPTAVETGVPTSKPTKAPSDEPTSKPTKVPTKKPTKQPTHVPTLKPTKRPTENPTAHPSHKPTNVPTESESTSPTLDMSDTLWTVYRDGYSPLPYFLAGTSEIMTYKILKDHAGVIEPYANMRLYVEGYDATSQYTYELKACGSDDCSYSRLSVKMGSVADNTFTVQCKAFDVISLTLTMSYDSNEVAKVEKTALCMYVRREIRDLTDVDLNATMDAMYTLWSVDTTTGKELYGDNYESIDYFLEFHHFNAAFRESDHFHEGNGFVAQHLKLTNMYEAAIQTVDRSVSLPYWDFTIEAADGTYMYNSPIMSPKMFGSMTQPQGMSILHGYRYDNDKIDDFAISDGRWAYIKAHKNPDKFSSLQAGYGYMRSPWNMNPSKYITRFSGTTYPPDCKTHYAMLEYTDLMDFMISVENAPHATTHGGIGGSYGCDMFDPLLEKGYITSSSSLLAICKLWIFSLKVLYRKNFLSAATDCELPDDVQEAACPFQCNIADYTSLTLTLKNNILGGYIPTDISSEGIAEWINFICGGDGSRVFSGDHLESASPTDPSFWPIHPTIERVLQAKFMAGGFETTEWGKDAVDDHVCVRSTCYVDGVYGEWDLCCYGHFENDQMFDPVSGDRNSFVGATNKETIAGTDPTSDAYSMPYIYDSFSWDHCVDEGFDFQAKLDELYAASSKR